jgi:hypothetical protein
MLAPLIRVALYSDLASAWHAHALERDLEVSAPSAEVALDGLLKLLHAHILYDRRAPTAAPAAPAPHPVWKRFASAAAVSAPLRVRGGDERAPFHVLVARAVTPPVSDIEAGEGD